MKKIILVLSLATTLLLSCKGKKAFNDTTSSSHNKKEENENFNASLSLNEKKALARKLKDDFKALEKKYHGNYYYYDYRYISSFGPKWTFYSIESKPVIFEFKKYFGNTKYKVIWNWDVDGDGHKEFLGVEIVQGVNRGIKRGILVDELGKVKLYIDTIKGVYAIDDITGKTYMVLDLNRLGIRGGELKCYSIGYLSEDMVSKMINYKFTRKKFHNVLSIHQEMRKIVALSKKDRMYYDKINQKYEVERKKYKKLELSLAYSYFSLQMIDRDLKVIDINLPKNSGINLVYIPNKKKVEFQIETIPFSGYDFNQSYDIRRGLVEKHRITKKNEKMFSPPAKFNKEYIKKALKLNFLYD